MKYLLLLLPVLLPAQAPPVPEVSAYYRLPTAPTPSYRWLHLDNPFTLTVDKAGDPHLRLTPLVTAGFGILTVTDETTSQVQVSLDTARIAYRSIIIPSPGVCNAGTGTWAGDDQYFYFCTQNTNRDGFIWARVAVVTDWSANPLQRCTQDAFGNVTCTSLPAPQPVVTYVDQKDETATFSVDSSSGFNVWTLLFVPEQNLVCTRNGTVQGNGSDYTQRGPILSSGVWLPADAIVCSYSRRQ